MLLSGEVERGMPPSGESMFLGGGSRRMADSKGETSKLRGINSPNGIFVPWKRSPRRPVKVKFSLGNVPGQWPRNNRCQTRRKLRHLSGQRRAR